MILGRDLKEPTQDKAELGEPTERGDEERAELLLALRHRQASTEAARMSNMVDNILRLVPERISRSIEGGAVSAELLD